MGVSSSSTAIISIDDLMIYFVVTCLSRWALYSPHLERRNILVIPVLVQQSTATCASSTCSGIKFSYKSARSGESARSKFQTDLYFCHLFDSARPLKQNFPGYPV